MERRELRLRSRSQTFVHLMNLAHPREQLAGCYWLQRLAAKTRAYLQGEMPLSYRAAFGSRIDMDGYFFRHFQLSREEIIAAVRAAPSNEQLAKWFLARPAVTLQLIDEWNEFAPRIGARGNPGYVTRILVKWIFCPKSIARRVRSLFEAIEQDEGLAP
jgi:hypothetical protein